MRVYVEGPELERIADIVKEVARVYRAVIHNKALLLGKLNSLRVDVNTAFTDTTVGFFADNMELEERKGAKYNITIYVNLEDDERKIAFIVAHEFAHLVFANNLDVLRITGKTRDNSSPITSFIRISPDGEVYGNNIEEFAADYLSRYIVKKLYSEEYSSEYAEFLKEKNSRFDVVERLSKFFGKSLNECDFIDDFQLVDDDNSQFAVVSNDFWYAVTTMSMDTVINRFNKQTKQTDGYRKLCGFMDSCEEDKIKMDLLNEYLKKSEEYFSEV